MDDDDARDDAHMRAAPARIEAAAASAAARDAPWDGEREREA